MLTTNNHDILFDDLATITLMHAGHSPNAAIIYNDCTNNAYRPQTAANLSSKGNYSGYNIVEDDLLFNDLNMIEARLGRGYLQMTTANANCDCGR